MACCACFLVDLECLRANAALDKAANFNDPGVSLALRETYDLHIVELVGETCLSDLCAREALRKAGTPPDPDTFAAVDAELIERLTLVTCAYFEYYWAVNKGLEFTSAGPKATASYTTTEGIYLAGLNARKEKAWSKAGVYADRFKAWWNKQRALDPNPYPCAGASTNNCGCSTETDYSKIAVFAAPTAQNASRPERRR